MINLNYLTDAQNESHINNINSIDQIIKVDKMYFFDNSFVKNDKWTPMSSIGSNLLEDWVDLRAQIYDNILNLCKTHEIDENVLKHVIPCKETNHLLNFEIIKEIASGAHGIVYKVQDKQTKSYYALKKFRPQSPKEFENNYIKDFSLEIYISLKVLHPNIISSKSAFYYDNNLYLLMDLSSSSYFDAIKNKTLNSTQIRRNMFQLYKALEYLEKENILHRDIKLENLVLDGDNIKLCDFGFSTLLESDEELSMWGSEPYMAPELFDSGILDYNPTKLDPWSFGFVYLTCLNGSFPFTIANPSFCSQYSKFINNRCKFVNSLSIDFEPNELDFLFKLLDPNYKTRFTTLQLSAHPWLKHISSL